MDLQHDVYGSEVTAIHKESDAKAIEDLLRKQLPDWHFARTFYEEHNLRELGWKVMISRSPETYDDASPIHRRFARLAPIFYGSTPWYLTAGATAAFGLTIAVASVLVGLIFFSFSRGEIVATLILLPTFFAAAGVSLSVADTIRGRMRRPLEK